MIRFQIRSFRDSRSQQQLADAAAIEQARADLALQREFDRRVAVNIARRIKDGRYDVLGVLGGRA